MHTIKRGSVVLIKKGTKIRQPTAPKSMPKERVAGRDYIVTVHHLLEGYSCPARHMHDHELKKYDVRREDYSDEEFSNLQVVITKPKICWAGSSGYWCEVDINDLEQE
jgi:hypothetical protein